MLITQIYLPEEQHAELNRIAKKLDTSMAEIIRKMISFGLKRKIMYVLPKEKNDLWKLADANISGGPKNLSDNLDKYLYDENKKDTG